MTSPSLILIVACLILPAPIARLSQAPSSGFLDLSGALSISNRHLSDAAYKPIAATEPKQSTITGIVLALGPRVNRDDGGCRQLMVVRATGRGNGSLKNKYLIVSRNYNCDAGDFTNETFQNRRKWRFPLIRDADCDTTFERIKDIPSVHPPGVFERAPWMKFVPGNDGEKMSLKQKLLCHEINGELMPAK